MIACLSLYYYFSNQFLRVTRQLSRNLRVLPGLDSRLDILEPLFEPMGIRERALVGVRAVDER